MKKILLAFGFCFVIGLGGWCAMRLYVPSSEPFRAAEKFLASNAIVADQIGRVDAVRLPAFNEWEISYEGKTGQAFFAVEVTGSSGQVAADIKLAQKSEVWKVVAAEISTRAGVIKLMPGREN